MSYILALDFDGTCVTHEYPDIGKDVDAVKWLRYFIKNNIKIILWTMRSDKPDEPYLTHAVGWFNKNNIPLFAINQNPDQKSWTTSPKAYAHAYLDDAAIGCPLYYPRNGNRPYVNWDKAGELLCEKFKLKIPTF